MPKMNAIGAFFKKVEVPCKIIVALHTDFKNVEKFLHNSSCIKDAQYIVLIEDTPGNTSRIGKIAENCLDYDCEIPFFRFRLTFYDRQNQASLELEHIATCPPENCKELNAWVTGLFTQVEGKIMIVKL